jgi:acyl-CoA synthetase (AMP-forming)/AMP-acid ligase II
MKKFTSIPEMIAIHAKDTPAADAITAPAAKPLTYQALNQLVEDTVNTLNRLGVGRGDRIGIVLPNCPEMATAFVAIASGCTAAPLNMAYRADEFEFYLLDLKARALVVAAGSDTPGYRDPGADAPSRKGGGQFHA